MGHDLFTFSERGVFSRPPSLSSCCPQTRHLAAAMAAVQAPRQSIQRLSWRCPRLLAVTQAGLLQANHSLVFLP